MKKRKGEREGKIKEGKWEREPEPQGQLLTSSSDPAATEVTFAAMEHLSFKQGQPIISPVLQWPRPLSKW